MGRPEIRVNKKFQPKNFKLKDNKDKTKQQLEGDSSSHARSQSSHQACLSSRTQHFPLGKDLIGGESNEGCLGGDNGEDPPQNRPENPHVVDPLQNKRRNSKASQEIELVQDCDEMEVDDALQILDWEVI